MNKLDLLLEQCYICCDTATKEDCDKCEKHKEINYMLQEESEET